MNIFYIIAVMLCSIQSTSVLAKLNHPDSDNNLYQAKLVEEARRQNEHRIELLEDISDGNYHNEDISEKPWQLDGESNNIIFIENTNFRVRQWGRDTLLQVKENLLHHDNDLVLPLTFNIYDKVSDEFPNIEGNFYNIMGDDHIFYTMKAAKDMGPEIKILRSIRKKMEDNPGFGANLIKLEFTVFREIGGIHTPGAIILSRANTISISSFLKLGLLRTFQEEYLSNVILDSLKGVLDMHILGIYHKNLHLGSIRSTFKYLEPYHTISIAGFEKAIQKEGTETFESGIETPGMENSLFIL